MTTTRIILASSSPRRRELLSRAGYEFTVVSPEVDESLVVGEAPRQMVERLALEKAHAVAAQYPDAIVIGSDTTVVCDDVILGKPLDVAEAQTMLLQLSGRTHAVLTAVAIVCVETSHAQVECASAAVTMRVITPEEIAAYIATGEPMDKAGAYAAQGLGKQFIARIEGDETTVIGLPMDVTQQLLAHAAGRNSSG